MHSCKVQWTGNTILQSLSRFLTNNISLMACTFAAFIVHSFPHSALEHSREQELTLVKTRSEELV